MKKSAEKFIAWYCTGNGQVRQKKIEAETVQAAELVAKDFCSKNFRRLLCVERDPSTMVEQIKELRKEFAAA